MKPNTKKRIDPLVWPSLVTFVLFVTCAAVSVYDVVHPVICTESSNVTSILSLDYRSADILLENGSKVTVNQATLKPGDAYCVKYNR